MRTSFSDMVLQTVKNYWLRHELDFGAADEVLAVAVELGRDYRAIAGPNPAADAEITAFNESTAEMVLAQFREWKESLSDL